MRVGLVLHLGEYGCWCARLVDGGYVRRRSVAATVRVCRSLHGRLHCDCLGLLVELLLVLGGASPSTLANTGLLGLARSPLLGRRCGGFSILRARRQQLILLLLFSTGMKVVLDVTFDVRLGMGLFTTLGLLLWRRVLVKKSGNVGIGFTVENGNRTSVAFVVVTASGLLLHLAHCLPALCGTRLFAQCAVLAQLGWAILPKPHFILHLLDVVLGEAAHVACLHLGHDFCACEAAGKDDACGIRNRHIHTIVVDDRRSRHGTAWLDVATFCEAEKLVVDRSAGSSRPLGLAVVFLLGNLDASRDGCLFCLALRDARGVILWPALALDWDLDRRFWLAVAHLGCPLDNLCRLVLSALLKPAQMLLPHLLVGVETVVGTVRTLARHG